MITPFDFAISLMLIISVNCMTQKIDKHISRVAFLRSAFWIFLKVLEAENVLKQLRTIIIRL